MRRKRFFTRAVIWGAIIGAIALLALPAASLATVVLQVTDEPPRQLNAKDVAAIGAQAGPAAAASAAATAFDAHDAPGTLVARGSATQPTGPLRLVTYLLEEVSVPIGAQVPTLSARGGAGPILRLTVLGGPFPVRSISPVIWVDDTPLRSVGFSPDRMHLSVLAPDRAALRNGAVLAVSYGESPADRHRLPETLTLPASLP